MADTEEQIKQGGLPGLGESLTQWTEKWIPDSLVIVFILSIIAYIMALIWGFDGKMGFGDRLYGGVVAWGKLRKARLKGWRGLKMQRQNHPGSAFSPLGRTGQIVSQAGTAATVYRRR